MNERPTVRTLQANQADYPEWQICPLCHGGRGEVVPTVDEATGEPDFTVRECARCGGEKVIRRPIVV